MEKMGYRKTGSFLDVPLRLGCGDHSAKSLPLQLDSCRLKNLI